MMLCGIDITVISNLKNLRTLLKTFIIIIFIIITNKNAAYGRILLYHSFMFSCYSYSRHAQSIMFCLPLLVVLLGQKFRL